AQRYQDWVGGITQPSYGDTIAGLGTVLLIVELTRRCTGWGLTLVLLAALGYTAFGQHISGTFHHDPLSLEYFLYMQTVGVDGIFGTPLEVAATYAFLFVLFGSFYQIAGGGQLFFDIAAALTRGMTGGPAKACVVSSGLYGSISGSPVADVATTGPINIPIMVRTGIPATRSAAIEAAASSGGALLPPVMGAVAFMMADYTGTPYHRIMEAALIPALLYYVSVFLLVHLEAGRDGQSAIPDSHVVGLTAALRRGWVHLLSIAALLYFLIDGYTPTYVAAGATVAVVLLSFLRSESAISPRRFIAACKETVVRVAPLTAAVAAAGVIIGCIELTGLAGKFTALLFTLSGGQLVPSLVVAAAVIVLLGMGMPTPGVYVMGVALIAPVLIGVFELPVLPVHFFMLYIACMSAITPPVAVACFTAGAIADANPFKVAPYACKLAYAGFILPFFLLFNPGILMRGSLPIILLHTALAVVLVVAVAMALHGWAGRRRLLWPVRLLFGVVAVGVIYPDWRVQASAAAAFIILGSAVRFGCSTDGL
ncbi:MAG: TRAP transporter permease, partial [Hyphomicrobiaceae bacterium]